MSNEELALAIQQGDRERMGELWEQIEGLVKWKASRIVTALELQGRSCGVEYDDLVQCGFPAMVSAVETYKPENGAFSTWFMVYLKKEFAEATGTRTSRSYNEPLNAAVSLDAPIGDDSDSAAMWEIIPDPLCMTGFEAVEAEQYRGQLHNALEAAMGELSPVQADILRRRYWQGLALRAIGEDMGKSGERVRGIEREAIRELRRPRISRQLKCFIDFDMYHGTGLGAFLSSGNSIQERYVLKQERMEERLYKRRSQRASNDKLKAAHQQTAQAAGMTLASPRAE